MAIAKENVVSIDKNDGINDWKLTSITGFILEIMSQNRQIRRKK